MPMAIPAPSIRIGPGFAYPPCVGLTAFERNFVMMKLNLGKLDRSLRVLVGGFVFSLGFWGPHTAWSWLGLILVVTGLFGHCPTYPLLGLRTCPRDR